MTDRVANHSPSPLAPDAERLARKLDASDRPYLTLKAAATLDGKIAMPSGESQWITGETARAHAMLLRAGHDAVLVGMGTVRSDDPRLTVRLPNLEARPTRIVLDSLASIAQAARLLSHDGARRIVVTGREAPDERREALQALGAEVLACASAQPRPAEYLPLLRAAGLRSVLVEGGARVHADLIAHQEADALFLYVSGRVIGDETAPAWCGALGLARLADAPRIRLAPPETLGEDVLLRGWFD